MVGAIAPDGCRRATPPATPWSSWLNVTSLAIGALFVATSAYLAAVFLVYDARRAGARDLERYFTDRALIAGAVAGVLAVVGIIALHHNAHYVYDRLTSKALPLVIVSAPRGRRGRWSSCAAGRSATRGRSPSSPSSRSCGAGAWRSTRTCCRRS